MGGIFSLYDQKSGELYFRKSKVLEMERECMISQDALVKYIEAAMPDARVTVKDRTGTMDHYQVQVVSGAFEGKNLLDRQRFVYKALDVPMKDGRIHALEIKSQTPEESTSDSL